MPYCKVAWYFRSAVLRFCSAALVVLVLAFVGLGYVLPTEWEAKRTSTFETTPARVAEIIGQLDTWADWSHLSAHVDADTEVSVSGATLSWGGGELLGDGVLANFSTTEDCATYDLVSGELKSSGRLCWEQLAQDDPEAKVKTRLTWSETGTSDGGPLVRWFGFLSIDAALGARFEAALGRLETLVKAEPQPEPETPAGDDDDSGSDDDDSAADDDDSAVGPDTAGDDDSAKE